MNAITKRLRSRPDGNANPPVVPAVSTSGTARLGRKTKDLVKQLEPGDVAVIGHRNIDRIAAEDLVASGIKVVLNNQPSSDDKYPNRGPLILVDAGVRLIDFGEDDDLFELLNDGDRIQLDGPVLMRDGARVATGVDQLKPDLDRRLATQQEQIHLAL
ncbi:MAG: hypothetical protein M3Y45_00785, partial [Actinomycetota bacterium]|nr:hypothetical protein [Actinomycetota bacterium]